MGLFDRFRKPKQPQKVVVVKVNKVKNFRYLEDLINSGKNEKKEQTSPLTLALAGACGLLLILLILQGAILRRKLHRLEEDKL